MKINGRELGSFEITTYRYENGLIVIDKVKALDTEGKYIKFAKLEPVIEFLSKYPVTFKPKEQ